MGRQAAGGARPDPGAALAIRFDGFSGVQVLGEASATGDDQRQVVILMGGTIAHAGSEGEDGIVQKRCAVGFLNAVHSFEQPREGRDVEAVQLEEMLQMGTYGVGHGW